MEKHDLSRAQQLAHILTAMDPLLAKKLLYSLDSEEMAELTTSIEQIDFVSPESIRQSLEEFMDYLQQV